jgi:LssY C-terminus
MRTTFRPAIPALFSLLLNPILFSSPISAQLVGEDRTAPASSNQSASPVEKAASKAGGSAAPGALLTSKEFPLEGSKVWTDTGIALEPGERVVVTGTGNLRYTDAKADNGPEGLTRGFRDLLRVLPFNNAGRGALIAKIGDPEIAEPFLIGTKKEIIAPISGKLIIGINQSESDTGDGSYKVKVQVYASSDSSSREVARVVPSIPGIDKPLFARIPRRITDKAGNLGDMVNFLIIGNEDQMKKVFTTAGWVKVDANVDSTILTGIIASMSKESYLTMPMSPLYLFDRHQDYGWAHAEPIAVVASRNHLRIWKAPFTVNGQMLWVGAATHDIGFEKDQRNNGITHKIDPNIDLERDYVEKTLSSTGLVSELTHFLPENPMQEAKTASGGSFHSNGQVLILKLVPQDPSTSASSARHGIVP